MGGQTKKKKLGIKLTLVGIILGIITGFGILGIQSFIAGELHTILNDEARKACNCSFDASSIEISLLTLSGKAKDARILRNGEPRLLFREVETRFSLTQLGQKRIVLSDLHLKDGVAYNVDQDSVTFQLIDSLSTLPPPEKRKEDRWKLHLEQLRVSVSRFTQDYPGTYITGNHISLLMTRDDRDRFQLRPTIGNLSLTLKRTENRPYEKTVQFGKVTSLLTLEDSQAIFEKLKVSSEHSGIHIDAIADTKNNNALSGTSKFVVDTLLLQLNDFIKTQISGKAALSGSLGNPGMQGSFKHKKLKPVPFLIQEIPLFTIDSFQGDFLYDLNRGKHLVSIPNFSASGPETQVKLTNPITLFEDSIEAGFSISVGSYVSDGIMIEDIDARVDLGDTLDSIALVVTGQAQRARIGNFILPSASFSIKNKPELAFSITHASTASGAFSLTGILASHNATTVLRDGQLELRNLSLAQDLKPEDVSRPSALKKILLSGSAKFSGPLSPYQLVGNGAVTVTSRHFAGETAVTGKIELENGILSAELFNTTKSFNGSLQLNFLEQNGEAALDFKKFRPAEYFPDASCLELSAGARYGFALSSPTTGNGAISIKNLLLGCKPYSVTLQRVATIPIENGTATLNDLTLTSAATDFTLNGSIAPELLNVTAEGSLYLNTLLGFIPALDDLSGSLDAALKLQGTFTEPVINGTAAISNGDFSSEASDLIATNMNGTLSLRNNLLTIDYLTGSVNSGNVSIQGEAELTKFQDASLIIDIEQMAINSVEDVSLTVSSSLRVTQGEQLPLISGEVEIDVLEARKNINLPSILKAIVRTPLETTPAATSLRELPAIELDVRILAPRNIFLISNFLTAEFAANLQLTGTLNQPAISGVLTSQAGWLGLKNRRFEITSGVVTFSQDPTNPTLEIIGETSVFGKTGQFVTIILEATGPLAAPAIELTSDTGLTQNEILNLLTSNVREFESTKANTLADRESGGTLSLVDERPGNAIRNMLHELTTLDELAVEPALNNRTGAIEPSLTATKRITDDLAIVGNTFVGPETSSRLQLRYDLTPYLNIAAAVDSINTVQNTSLGVDLTYTVFARKKPFIKYAITGNNHFDEVDLLKGIRLGPESRIQYQELPDLTKRFEQFYANRGFLHALAVLDCDTGQRYCRTLRAKLFEGPQARISGRMIAGDPLPGEVEERDLPSISRKQLATEEVRRFQQQSMIELLRSEGYLSARVRAFYDDTQTHDVQLILELTVGSQDSFIFSGNTVFKPEEFLETINLFNRKQPFGRNTIHILIENMERMYREAGYLFASISYEREIDTVSKKTTYFIHVLEEIPVSIARVKFSGNKQLEQQDLLNSLKQHAPEKYSAVFKPKVVVAERLDESCAILKSLYQLEGYPEASVTYKLIGNNNEHEFILEYVIKEESPLIFNRLHVLNFPAGSLLPEPPEGTLSVPRINQYMKAIEQRLKEDGYRSATIQTELEHNEITISVQKGDRTFLGNVAIEGLVDIPETLVRESLLFTTGDPWKNSTLQQSRRKLLLLGLFSRVEITPADGEVNPGTEDLLIRVVERSLTTLEIGGGINSELGIHTFGEAVDKSIFLDGTSLGTRLDLFVDEQTGEVNQGVAGLRYAQPQFLGTQFQFTQDARFQKTELTTLEYDLERYILDSAWYHRFTDDLTLNLSYSLLQDSISNVAQDAQLSHLDKGIVNLSLLGATIRWDKRDSPIIPNDGFIFTIDPGFTSKGIGSDANFYSLNGRIGYLHPFFNTPFTIAENFRMASAWTYGGTPEVPITQRYYLGGRQSVRGFRENSLGPRGRDGSILGGDVLIQNNLELRYRVQETVSTHVFFDAGNVFLRSQDIKPEDLRTSIGLGARYLSPIGPIGFDIGHPLDERPGEPSVRFHFSIGSTF